MGGPGTANNHRPEPLMLHLTVLHDVIIIIIIIIMIVIIIIMFTAFKRRLYTNRQQA